MARIGVDLGGTKIEIAVLDADGQVLLRERIATPQSYGAKIKTIARLVHDAEARLGQPGLSVGVGHPGSHSPRTGLVRNANSTALNGQPLRRDLQTALSREVRCANDANCFALSEAVDGAGSGAASVFGVILGTGVGAGLVLHGQLVEGQDSNTGEWGHMGLPWARADEVVGPPCSCGRSGCVEAWCSGPALAADHLNATGEAHSASEIADAARRGDAGALATLGRHLDRLARALASVINLIDPEVIVLGGGLSKLPGLVDGLNAKLPEWVFSDAFTTRIALNQHGDSSGVRGAAWLWPDRSGTP